MWLRRRDLPPVLLLVLLIILVLLTLSQILVVHNGRYGRIRNSYKIKKLQKEMQELEASIRSMLARNVPSMKRFQDLQQYEVNARRIEEIFVEAEEYSRLLSHSCFKLADGNVVLRKFDNLSGNSLVELKNMKVDYQTVRNCLSNFQNEFFLKSDLPYCSAVPRYLKGKLNVSVDLSSVTEAMIEDNFKNSVSIAPGGYWRPLDCVARHKVAVIVPYRDRKLHLLLLLSHLHPLLQRQELDYRIFVVEQTRSQVFNKARLMNIGFIEAVKVYDFDCFVFHDVDLVPEDDRNMYSCPKLPRHLSVAVDEMNYKLAYKELVGGVLNMKREHFEMVNGYSNLYWGWGAEDDDMAYRIIYVGLRITRPPEKVARYKMIKHVKRPPSDVVKRLKLLYTGIRRYHVDGLNSLEYKLVSFKNLPYYTHFLVDIGEPPVNLW